MGSAVAKVLGIKKSTPALPPPPPPPDPTIAQQKAEGAAKEELKRRKAGINKEDTIIGGLLGDTSNTQNQKTLLGN